ncbi:5'-AMP-activated protein kinase subunit beta-2 [Arthroderma uncinatum]|uniref:5'-AMP-activated protein kinase subunit beta-2 n=1 Tax=Arthroderma uncinatum TaxID=74035 RepID=UPI00144ADAE0|nr:5'-AMP-activated protein kinase subunit beta-2 [Arthroderma uncinatum]KAF3483687.1 5'-AMP-activated protein kinase subunit beta-2 [Arthroderma uncinatum]
MGNAPSKTPGATAGGDKKVNRRTSIQALSGSKAPAADPSHSRESATGHPATQKQPPPFHQRLQSRTVETPVSSGGGGDRLERRNSRKHREGDHYDLPVHPKESQAIQPSPAVQVPDHAAAYRDQNEASTPRPVNTYYAAPSHLTRPPRLPLPIGDAMTAPGSPITASGSLGAAIAFDKAGQEALAEKSELDPAIDEDDVVQDELDSIVPTGFNKSVPTTIDWRGGGEKVYVTGTFVNWARKFKLHKRLFTIHLS